MAEQAVYENWSLTSAPGGWPAYEAAEATACSGAVTGVNQEIQVNYAYNGLGEVVRASVPQLRSGSQYLNVAVNWGSVAHTFTQTDALGRPKSVTAPHGQVTNYVYEPRKVKVQAVGRGEAGKWLRWTQYDGLGNLLRLRNYTSNGVSEAEVVLTHDVTGNLTRVDQAGGLGATTLTYDKLGRKISMNDPDLGVWRYTYDRLGNLKTQTDACGSVSTLTYDGYNQLTRQVTAKGTNCTLSGGTMTANYGYGSSGKSTGQLTEVKYADNSYRRNLSYNNDGLLASETVRIAGAPQAGYVTTYNYDAFLRPTSVTYPDGDVVTTSVNSMGLPFRSTSSRQGVLIDGVAGSAGMANGVHYNEVGQLVSMRMPVGNAPLWRTQNYYGWKTNSVNGNHLLSEIRVGATASGYNRLHLEYGYDSFANVKTLNELYNNSSGASFTFSYDDANRVTNAFGKTYTWQGTGNFAAFEGKGYTYDGTHRHAVDKVAGADRFDYDANGNMTVRNKGLSSAQTLAWNGENRLVSVSGNGVSETYAYSPDGQRVKKVSNGNTTYYINGYYEVEVRTVQNTPTPVPPTATPTRTNTPPPQATATRTPTRTNTPPPQATATHTPTATNTPVVPPTATDLPTGACLSTGPLALYRFEEGSGSTVTDVSGNGTPLNLTVSGSTNWVNGGGLKLNGGTAQVISSGAASKVISAAKANNAIAVEAWVKASVASQGGPARMVGISNGSTLRNLTLGHGHPTSLATTTQYDIRLRTSSNDNDDNGKPSLSSPNGTATTALTHLVFTRGSDGTARLYVNGVQKASQAAGGNLSNWADTYKLILGNETTRDRPWLGELHRVGIYSCALSAAEVSTLKSQPAHSGGTSPTATNTPTNTPPAQATATNTPIATATATVMPTNTPVSSGCGVPSGNLVSNGDFASGTTGWRFYSNGSASLSTASGPCGQAAQVAISSTGSNIQLYQSGISLQAGVQYVLRFDAKSDNGQDMTIYLHKHVSPYNSYGLNGEVANLTSTWQTFEYTFTASGFSGTTGDGRLRLGFNWRTGTFQVDDVSITPLGVATPTNTPVIQATPTNTPPAQATATNTPVATATPTVTPTNTPVAGGCGVPAGNLMANGDFAAGTTGWSFYSNGSASFSAVNGPCGQAAQVSISSTGSNIQLYQSGISLQAGVQYVLRFDAKSDNGQDMAIYLHKHGSPYNSYGLYGQVANLTSNWQTFEYIFTASGFSGTTGDGRLRLWFSGKTGTFQLDDVSITPVGVAAASVGREASSALWQAQQPGRLYLPAVANETSSVQAAAIDATTTIITKYYYFGTQRVAMAKGGEFRYLHGDHLGSTVMETNLSGAVITDQQYYAFGGQRDSGTRHHRAQVHRPEAGRQRTLSTTTPATTTRPSASSSVPTRLCPIRSRYLPTIDTCMRLGNPLKYSDPSGYYTNDEIMQHYGCEGWACVESHFGSGGSHDGLWGWLYTLQQAQDGYQVHASSFSGSIGMTQFSGVFHRGANGTIGVQGTNFSAQVRK